MDRSQTRIAAVILAGGRGERLGGVNKALIDFGGEALIDRALRVVAGCDPVLVAGWSRRPDDQLPTCRRTTPDRSPAWPPPWTPWRGRRTGS